MAGTLTNESHFGVLGMYPSKDDTIHIDGDASDWDKLDNGDKTKLELQSEGFNEIWATHDEGYLYLLVNFSESLEFSNHSIYLGFDTLKGGNRHAPQLQGKTLDEGLETLIELGDEDEGRMMIASNYDFHTRYYGHLSKILAFDPKELQDDSGLFKPWKLVVNYLLEHPDARFDHPFGDIDVGDLRRGTSNPQDPNYNSKAMWQVKGNTLEIRIPWMLLGFSDPSSLSAISYTDTGTKEFESVKVEGVRLVPWIVSKDSQKVIGLEGSDPYPVSKLPFYAWDRWEDVDVDYVERPKQSYYTMQKAMREVNQPVTE